MKRYIILWFVVLFFPILLSAAEKNKGELSTLVCFLSFADEENDEQFDKPISYYEAMFNADAAGVNSVYTIFVKPPMTSFSGKVLSSRKRMVRRFFLIEQKMNVDIIERKVVSMNKDIAMKPRKLHANRL